ncbi:MAG: hypothetical protein JWO82_2963 [Akkermansiaceae bacterium]|nr:hypothetical protein [Akkermansiaceae bacterium]
MARRRTSKHLSTIEYIGPRPQKKQVKRPNFLGGWVVLLIAAGSAYYFGAPLVSLVKAQQVPATPQAAASLIASLESTNGIGERLAAAALKQTTSNVSYDSSYYKISYPWGDIPSNKGKAEDLVIRSYRALGIDLQQKVHDDMNADLGAYSSLMDSPAPDPSNDHRRAVVLERFFERKGESLGKARTGEDYLPGDIVVWSRPDAVVGNGAQIPRHIGIVVPGPGGNTKEPWVVDHLDSTVKWENSLFSYQILGHYRYNGEVKAEGTAAK